MPPMLRGSSARRECRLLYKPDPAVPEVLAPRNAPGLGPVDFGAVAIQFLRNAYRETGMYAKEKPRTNLRLIANIQDPSYVLVAAKGETGHNRPRADTAEALAGPGPDRGNRRRLRRDSGSLRPLQTSHRRSGRAHG